jgi:hypothetical protein
MKGAVEQIIQTVRYWDPESPRAHYEQWVWLLVQEILRLRAAGDTGVKDV